MNMPGFINEKNYSDYSPTNDNFLLSESDTRYSFRFSQPVNPIVGNSTIGDKSEYSGGYAELLNIPLQMNNPNESEPLRSQKVLITPYNRIKYSSNGNC